MKVDSKFTSLVFLLGAGVFAFSSCNKIKDAIKVNIPMTMTVPVTIPPVSTANGNGTYSSFVKVNVDSIINANSSKLSVNNIQSVEVDSVSLNINSDSQFPQDNFTALQSITEYFYTDENSTKVELASAENPTDPYSANIPISSVPDLSNYFNATTFYFETDYQMKRPTTQAIEATATIKFTLQAGL